MKFGFLAVALALAGLLIPNVSAADGDLHFSENGTDQPWNWINEPSAFYYNGRTYVVFQGDAIAEMRPYVTFWDHAANRWATPVRVAEVNPVGGDGHGAPSLVIDSDGFIYVFYGSHVTAQKLAKSANPEDISSWTAMPDAATDATYPKPFIYQTDLWLVYREFISNNGVWRIRRSQDGGSTWNFEDTLISYDIVRSAYVGQTELTADRLYFSYVEWRPNVGFRRGVYACYYDFVDQRVETMAGVSVGVITELTSDLCKISETAGQNTWYSTMDIAPSGDPYVIYGEGNGTAYAIKFSEWTGAAWAAPQIITWTDGDSNYADAIIHGNDDVEAFLIVNGTVNPPGGGFGGTVTRWSWNGAAWTLEETILTDAASGLDLDHPVVPDNYVPEVTLTFQQFAPIQSGLRLYAWGDDGFAVEASSLTSENGIEGGLLILVLVSPVVILGMRRRKRRDRSELP